MSLPDFIHQTLKREKKFPIGFVTDSENKETRFIVEEHIHLSSNIEENYHYYGSAADSDSISKQLCLFHPYHPDLNCLERTIGFPETPISFECPLECVHNLPLPIKELLSEHKADKIFIRPFFQNMPWNTGVALMIRPHHIIFSPSTLEEKTNFVSGRYNNSQQCKVGIFLSNVPIIIDGISTSTLSPVMNFVSHGSGTGYTLCSPGMPGIVHGVDYNKTYIFYSITVTTINGNITPESKWYICPTTLLGIEDFRKILDITSSDKVRTILDLLRILKEEHFDMGIILTELLAIKSTDLEK